MLTRRFGRRRTLYAMLGALAIVMAVLAVNVENLRVLIVGIVIGGLFLGVMNTVLTESVMEATDLPRAVASSTYSGVRFVGGAAAPAPQPTPELPVRPAALRAGQRGVIL